MSARKATDRRVLWLCAGLGLALFAGANWHLVHVAIGTQPDCVPHLRGAGGADTAAQNTAAASQFRAAQSSCTP